MQPRFLTAIHPNIIISPVTANKRRTTTVTSPAVNELEEGVLVGEYEGAGDIEGSIVVIGSSVDCVIGKVVVFVYIDDSFIQYLAMNVILVEGFPPSLHPIALPLMTGPAVMRRVRLCTPPVVLMFPVSMPYVAK
jgi:hypothetical protein